MRLFTAHRILIGSALLVFAANAAGGFLSGAASSGLGWAAAAGAVLAYWRWVRARHGAVPPA